LVRDPLPRPAEDIPTAAGGTAPEIRGKTMMLKLIGWLWGRPLDRGPFGIGWPTMLDRRGEASTETPIWNWIWLRDRLGFKPGRGRSNQHRRLSMRSRAEQALVFMNRAKEFEEKAAREDKLSKKETLLQLAKQYRRLAELAAKGAV
jgi:hypothetical protein